MPVTDRSLLMARLVANESIPVRFNKHQKNRELRYTCVSIFGTYEGRGRLRSAYDLIHVNRELRGSKCGFINDSKPCSLINPTGPG